MRLSSCVLGLGLLCLGLLSSACGQKWATHDIGDDCTKQMQNLPEGAEFVWVCSDGGGYVLKCISNSYQPVYSCLPANCFVEEYRDIDPNTGKKALIEARPMCPEDQAVPTAIEGLYCAEGWEESRVCTQDRSAILSCAGGAGDTWQVEQECGPGECAVELEDYELLKNYFPYYRTKTVYCTGG